MKKRKDIGMGGKRGGLSSSCDLGQARCHPAPEVIPANSTGERRKMGKIRTIGEV